MIKYLIIANALYELVLLDLEYIEHTLNQREQHLSCLKVDLSQLVSLDI